MTGVSNATQLMQQQQQQQQKHLNQPSKYPTHRKVLFSGVGRDSGGGGGGFLWAKSESDGGTGGASSWDASEVGLLVIACLLLCTVTLLTVLSIVFCKKRNTVFVAEEAGLVDGCRSRGVRGLERAKEQEMIELDLVLSRLDGCSESGLSSELECNDRDSVVDGNELLADEEADAVEPEVDDISWLLLGSSRARTVPL